MWAPVTAILAWLVKNRVEKIEAKADAALSRAEFVEYKTAAQKDRDERRQTELALFEKMDDLRGHVDAKFDGLTTIILNSRNT